MTSDETSRHICGNCYQEFNNNVHSHSCARKDPVASNTGKELKPPKWSNGHRCDHCSAWCQDDCRLCAAPQCCPQCCKIASLESSLEGMKKRNEEQESQKVDYRLTIGRCMESIAELERKKAELDMIVTSYSLRLKTAEDKLATYIKIDQHACCKQRDALQEQLKAAELRASAYRDLAIKLRDLWEPSKGEYSASEQLIDESAARIMKEKGGQ